MKTIEFTKKLSCAVVLALVPVLTSACSKKPIVTPEPEPLWDSRNMYFGFWEGSDRKGDVYTIGFISGDQWECRIDKDGVSMPHYRGTYKHSGTRLELLIKEEADPRTMGWRAERGNLGPHLTGALSNEGRILNIRAITEANFTKKR